MFNCIQPAHITAIIFATTSRQIILPKNHVCASQDKVLKVQIHVEVWVLKLTPVRLEHKSRTRVPQLWWRLLLSYTVVADTTNVTMLLLNHWSFSSHSLILIEWWWLPNLSILRYSTHSKTHISGMCQLAGHSWKILHSVLSCRLIWQSWQSYCNWFYQGNPFLPLTVIFVSLILY